MQLRRLVSAMDLSSVSVRGVTGWEGRTNDVVTLRDRDPALMERVIVFCGGDVQDLEERMLRHRDNSRYSQWSLERTAMLLANVTIIIICTMTRLMSMSGLSQELHCRSEASPDGESHLQLL